MADVVDDDTMRAVRVKWAEDHEFLPALLDEPPKAGRLKSPQHTPYVAISCEFLRRESAGTAGAWHDYRKVTLTVRGDKDRVVEALGRIGNLFNRDTVLVYPSGARFIRWWTAPGSDKLMQEETTKDGKDVWAGSTEAEVWSIRL